MTILNLLLPLVDYIKYMVETNVVLHLSSTADKNWYANTECECFIAGVLFAG